MSEGKNVEDIVPKLYEQPNYQNSHENYQKVPDMNEWKCKNKNNALFENKD